MTSPAKSLTPEIIRNIAQSGQHLFGVFPLADTPHDKRKNGYFIYTIGNYIHKLPELLIVGPFDMSTLGAILNHVGEQMRLDAVEPADGSAIDIGGSYPLKVRHCGDRAKTDYTVQVGQFKGDEEYKVVQLLLCDRDGVYPDQPGCAEPFNVDMP